MPCWLLKGPSGNCHAVFPVEIIGGEAEIGEEDKDVLAVGNGVGAARWLRVCWASRLGARWIDAATPCPVVRLRQMVIRSSPSAAVRKDAIADQDGGGLPGRQIRLPQDVLLRPELGGQGAAGRAESGAVRAAKLRPVGAGEAEREQRIEEGAHNAG